jgi:hypothetical protein
MAAARVYAIAATLVALNAAAPLVGGAFAPATAQEPVRAEPARPRPIERPHACLNPKERQAAVESGSVIRLAAVLHAIKGRMPGTLVRARLCRSHQAGQGLVYVLTVLGHDGKVVRLVVDAAKGTVVGGL